MKLVRTLPWPRIAPLLPGVLVVLLWVIWAWNSGGYFTRSWYPGAIGAVILLAVTAVANGSMVPDARPARMALMALGALVVGSFLSILWADSPGSALESSNKLLLYLAIAWVLSLLPWDRTSASVMLGVWGMGLASVAALSLIKAAGATDLSSYIFELRYQHPVGYTNGNAALGVIGFLPLLALSHSRATPLVLKALYLAGATLLVEFALLAQARGSAVGAAVALTLLFVLVPDRLRLLGRMVVVGAAGALAAKPIFDVYGEGGDHALPPLIDDAVRAIALSVLLAGLAGLAFAWLERALETRPRAALGVRRGGLALLAVVLLALAGTAVVKAGTIAREASDEFETLTRYDYERSKASSRVTQLDPYERPDYWRVAIDLFEDSPLHGAGTGNFAREYNARRHEPKHSRYTHNVVLRALGEGGLPGVLLLLAFAAAALVPAAWACRRLDPIPRVVIGACLAVGAYALVHGSFDWLDEIPAVASPAVGLPFVALGLAFPASRLRWSLPWVRGPVWAGVLAAFVVLSLFLLFPAYLSSRYASRAAERAPTDLQGAFEDYDRAQDLNPLWVSPHLSEGRLALEHENPVRARAAFERSLDVEDNWLAHFELALIDSRQGRRAAAQAGIRRAALLNVQDPLLKRVRRRIEAGERLDFMEINRLIRSESGIRFTRRVR